MLKSEMTDLLQPLVAGERLVFVQSALWSVPPLARSSREAWLRAFVDLWLEVTSPRTTLVMPTFTFAYCRTRQFSRADTPSEAGELTEAFRQLPGVERGGHPIYSVAAVGPLAAEVCAHPGPTCLGAGTPFEYLERNDALLVGFGEPFSKGLTLLHRAEELERVPYRYFKTFPGIADGRPVDPRFYVRRLDKPVRYDSERLHAELVAQGLVHPTPCAPWLETMRAGAFMRHLRPLLAADPLCLLVDREAWTVERAAVVGDSAARVGEA